MSKITVKDDFYNGDLALEAGTYDLCSVYDGDYGFTYMFLDQCDIAQYVDGENPAYDFEENFEIIGDEFDVWEAL